MEHATTDGAPAAVRDARWDDWRWQAGNVLTTAQDLAPWVALTDEERGGIDATAGSFRLAVTPYYAALMDRDDPACPIRRQAVPHLDEATLPDPGGLRDPLDEDRRMPVPGVVHRYPDRALLLVNNVCPVYCRFCTRKRLTGQPNATLSTSALEAAYAWLSATPAVREVILSGGDPLLLPDDRLVAIVASLHAIPSVDLVRIHTRLPVVLPQRVTPALAERLSPVARAGRGQDAGPVWVVTHFNHPKELTPEARTACARLVDAGVPVDNQTVLLLGVNDDAEVLAELFRTLITWRVRPYYLHHCDPVEGAAHFRTPLHRGPALLASLRGRVSGLALPQFVVDAPGGGGKVPIAADPVLARTATTVTLRTPLNGPLVYRDPPSNDAGPGAGGVGARPGPA